MAEVETFSGFRVYKHFKDRNSYHKNHLRRLRNEYVVESLFGTNEQALPNSKTRKLAKKLKSLQEISDTFFQRVKLEPEVLEAFKNVFGSSFEHGTIDHESFLKSEKNSHFKLIRLLFETLSGNYDRILDLENQVQSLTDENSSLNAYVSDVQEEMTKLRKFASDCNEMRVSELGIQSEEYQILYEKHSSLQEEMKTLLQKNYKLEKQVSKILERDDEEEHRREGIREEGALEVEQLGVPYGVDLFEPELDESRFQSKVEEYEKRIEEMRKSNNALFDENIRLKKKSQESFGAEKFVTLSLLFNQITRTHNKLFQDQQELERAKADTETYQKLSMALYDAKMNTLEYENRTYKEKLGEMEETLKLETVGRFSLESIVSQLKMELHQAQQVYLKLETLNSSLLTNGHELDLVKTNRDVLSEQLSRMKHMVTSLTKEKHELSSKVFNLEYTKETLLKELDVLKDQVRKVERLLMDRAEDRLDFKDKITNIQLETNAKILEDKLIRIKMQNDELKLENTNLTTSMIELKNNLERERRENSELMKKVSLSMKNEAKMTAEMQQIANEINGLKASLETGAVNLRHMSDDLGLMNRKLFEKDLQLSALEAKRDTVTSALTEFAAKLSRCRLNTVSVEELRSIDIKALNYGELIQLLTSTGVTGATASIFSVSGNTVSFSTGGQSIGLNAAALSTSGNQGALNQGSGDSTSQFSNTQPGGSFANPFASALADSTSGASGYGQRGSKRGSASKTVLKDGTEEHLMRSLTNLINFNEFLSVLCVNLAKQLGTLTNNMLNVTNFSNIYETFKMELVDVDTFKNECMVKISDLETKIVSLEQLNEQLGEKHVWEKSIVRLKENYEKSLSNYKMMLKECRHLLKLNETALDSLRSENSRLLADCSGAANVMVEYENKLADSTSELMQLKELIFTVLPRDLKTNATRETPMRSIELLMSYLNNIGVAEPISVNYGEYGARNRMNEYRMRTTSVHTNNHTSPARVNEHAAASNAHDIFSTGRTSNPLSTGGRVDANHGSIGRLDSATSTYNRASSNVNVNAANTSNVNAANTSNVNPNSSYAGNSSYRADTNNAISSYTGNSSNVNANSSANEADRVSGFHRGSLQQYDQKRPGEQQELTSSSSSSARNRRGPEDYGGGDPGSDEKYEYGKEALMQKEQQLNDVYDDVNYYCKLIVTEIKSQMNADRQIDTDYESNYSIHEVESEDTVSDYKDEDYVVDKFEEILNLLNKLYYHRNYQGIKYSGSIEDETSSNKRSEAYGMGSGTGNGGTGEANTIVMDMNVMKSINKFAETLRMYYRACNKPNEFLLDDLEYQMESIPTIMDSEAKFKTFTKSLTKLMNLAGEFIYEQLTENSERMEAMAKQLQENGELIQKLDDMNAEKDQQLRSLQYELNEAKMQCVRLRQACECEKDQLKQASLSLSQYESDVRRLREDLEASSKKNEKLLLLALSEDFANLRRKIQEDELDLTKLDSSQIRDLSEQVSAGLRGQQLERSLVEKFSNMVSEYIQGDSPECKKFTLDDYYSLLNYNYFARSDKYISILTASICK
ncbi:uncharacterized protein TOT_040000536 [Theileria orientalis strain Shintoku]|uniref:Uncharacterized protein n=1 Tax=Theileria orientalis strain Shintoku TaxID=869250 RepID=J4C4G9_THEOR|nr:uncharacterized protein TOT_040000536 [Theileria orientalis strain Shintoku]BAM42166.1 uncharacterized protein TOT_040000536 [Theileria orientalis strain Shintoku]|eukprot:XP_009692467.1 uncharacterized protein TOT_040000536 [Theileria orientalis strain Shintoku]